MAKLPTVPSPGQAGRSALILVLVSSAGTRCGGGCTQCHPGVRLGQTQTKGPIVGTGGDGDSHHLYFVSLDGLLQRMRIHTGCFCASGNMCVCLTEAFVPSMGQPRSDLILVLVSGVGVVPSSD